MSKNYQTIIYDVEGPIAHVTLNRPEKLNAFNNTLFRELHDAIMDAGRVPEVKAIFLKGAGRAFSVGEDLSGEDTDEVVPLNPHNKPYQRDIYTAEQQRRQRWQQIFDCYKPIVAQVQGYCLGCAAELLMLCHTTVVAEDAVFGTPAIRAGFSSPSPLWVYRLGIRKAQDVLFTGRYFDGREARRMGLVTMAVPAAALDDEAEKALLFVSKEHGLGGGDGNIIGIGGIHPNFSAPVYRRIALDANGFNTAWGFTSAISAMSTIQRYGLRDDEFQFWDACEQRGFKAAIRERDEPMQDLFPFPRPNAGEETK